MRQKISNLHKISVIPLIVILVTGVSPAFAGPVIIDGTDSPDHGFRSGDEPRGNWPYIQNAIESLLADETRAGPHTVDILSIGTKGTSGFEGGAGGGAINSAADLLGVTVQHCGDPSAAQACFDGIEDGSINPRVLYFAGTGSGDDVGRNGVGPTLTANAQTISDFVASGGGVLSHGSGERALGWLGALLPDLEYPNGCTARGAALTPEGEELFPKITNENIRGICHNHFTGDFGGLTVLALDGSGRVFILGLLGEGTIEEGNIESGGGMNHWDTRPTFGISHEDRYNQVVENGFSFNGEYFTLTDNHHTDFAEQSVDIGLMNSFSATVYASKTLKVQEFLFGIPTVGEAHLAELGIEVWYDRDGNIDDVIVAQETSVIDEGTISVAHEKTFCLPTDFVPLCDTTTVSMSFLEPLEDKVMAVKAIDFENRDHKTYLNDGFDISGDSLNPMVTKMIPSNMKGQGLIEVTQLAKYSPYWQSENGRIFEMNNFGSFKEINHSFERNVDTGDAKTRMHSGFAGIIEYEQNRATELFDSTELLSIIPDSFSYEFSIDNRINEQVLNDMNDQAELAKKIIEEMDKQNRHY